MTRPTRKDIAMSEAIDEVLSASTIARCRDERLGPAGANALDHYRALAPFVGTGRSYDIAALRMASLGCPTRRLRTVLVAIHDPEAKDGEQVFEMLKVVISGAARRIADDTPQYDPSLGMPETPEEEAALIADGALEDHEALLNGETNLPPTDAWKVAAEVTTTLGGPPEPGRQVYADEWSDYMERFASVLRDARPAIEAASLEDLAAWVSDAAAMWARTSVRKLPFGEEDTWRIIGALAPAAGVFRELIKDVQSQIGGAS
jgi:hypothetical protein